MKKVEIINNKFSEFPIGIFDSGLGGLTVVKEIINLLPNENIIYLGDTARVPYGTKSRDTIIKYSIENTKFLLQKKIKILVVACNTASSYAIPTLKKMLKKIPVVGVIIPGSKKAFESTKNYKIGVIGTTATIKSESYEKTILNIAKTKNLKKRVKIYSQACPLFVPLIEEGWMDKIYQEKYYKKNLKKDLKETFEYRMINHENILRYVSSEYLLTLKQKGIDTLVLGCTHYPAIKKIIQDVIGENVSLIDSAKETAKYVYEIISKNKWFNISKNSVKPVFYVTDDPEKFKLIGSWLLQKNISVVKKVNLEKFI